MDKAKIGTREFWSVRLYIAMAKEMVGQLHG